VNANELADDLNGGDVSYITMDKAATMLRQQQTEIKELKQQVAFLEDWRDTWSPFLKAITGKVNEK